MSRKLGRRTEEEIDKNLKRAFDEIAEEPIPTRFASLLENLRQSKTITRPPDETPNGNGSTGE